MKKKLFGLISIVGILIFFGSCSNPSSSDDFTTYKVEVGVITNSTYTTAMNRISNWTELSYSNIASLRNYLYNNTISDHAIETENEIRLIKEIGNDIAFFETVYGNDKKAWMYVTK